MPVINVGSINVDHAYRVPHLVRPGETLVAEGYARGLGGKGMNQSIALARAGCEVCHVGAVGRGDAWVREAIAAQGIDAAFIADREAETGHAVIQIDAAAENCIVLHPGANRALRGSDVSAALHRRPGHAWVLTQNETGVLDDAIALALAAGRRVAFNPAPCEPGLARLPLERMALVVLNEIEVCQLAGDASHESAARTLRARCPETLLVVTLGAEGLWALRGADEWRQPAWPAEVLDTTAAGDTVTGYLLAGLDQGLDVPAALRLAARAAAITVARRGAAASIPWRRELPPAG